MTPELRDALDRYVGEIARELDLSDWRIHLRNDPCDEDANASMHPTYGRKVADLRLAGDFHDLTPELQRETLVHELLHLHLASATDVIRLGIRQSIGQAVYDVMWETFKQQIEYAVDGIALAIAPKMPLPIALSDSADTVERSSIEGGRHGHVEAEGRRAQEPEEGPCEAPQGNEAA